VPKMKKLFPRRPLDRLELDHPVFRSFHKYHDCQLPHLQGQRRELIRWDHPSCTPMNLGCRAAVLFSPWDLSCGWDEHTHEHGNRLLPGDSIRLGINLVSYIAALRQVAEVQSVDARDRRQGRTASVNDSCWAPTQSTTATGTPTPTAPSSSCAPLPASVRSRWVRSKAVEPEGDGTSQVSPSCT